MRKPASVSLLCIILLILLASCSSAGWLSDPYRAYSEDDYVCALGYGKNAAEADLDARRELASLFGMAVQSTVSRTLIETSVVKDGKTSESFGEYFTSNASITVAVDNLFGVEIAKRTTDKYGRFISLAVMERRTTADYCLAKRNSLKNQIEDLSRTIQTNFGTISAVQDCVELIGFCNEFNTNTVMYNYLTGQSLDFMSLSFAYSLYRTARDSVVLEVVVEGDDSGSVSSVVSKVFTDSGFSVSNGALHPTARITVSITWRETKGTGVASDFMFAEYNADVSFVDLAENETIMVFSSIGKEGHQSIDGAKARAVTGLVSQIDKDLRNAINGALTY